MQKSEGNIVYCQSCGKANQNDSTFCNYCGSRINSSQTEQKMNQTPEYITGNNTYSNEETERDFVIANLQDLNNLYFISRNFDENILFLIKKKEQLGIKRTVEEPPVAPGKPTPPGFGDFLGYCLFFVLPSILILPLMPIALIVVLLMFRRDKKEYYRKLEQEYPKELEQYNEAIKKYRQSIKDAEKEYEKEVNIGIPNLDRAIDDLNKERDEALKLIDECYDINIIPSKYRNIYAIKFIYDYMTTSNGTLRDALFACDLDKIQAQLEKVIQNQGSMICKLAKIEANSEKQIQQQEQMINHLKNIETNTYDTARATELNARYSRIIAHNTNVMAYCSAMTYIDSRDIDDFNYYSPQTIKDFGLERFAQYYEK